MRRRSPPTSPSGSERASSGLRSEVSVAARYPETVPAPVSGEQTQEIYTLFGTAVSSGRGTRTLTGVQAQGMTACPCAQEMVAGVARERLAERGYEPEQVSEIVEAVPIATHNQRGIGTLWVGCPEGCEADIDARELLRHRRAVDELGDLRADEAPRRAGGGREGPLAAPLRRGLRQGDGPSRHRGPHRPRPGARS